MDEVLNLFGDGGLARLKAGGQCGNATHDRSITSAHHNTARRTCVTESNRTLKLVLSVLMLVIMCCIYTLDIPAGLL